MAGYGQLAVKLSRPHRPQTLLDEHNAIYLLTQRMAETEPGWLRRTVMAREARAFARYEAEMCRAYDALLTVIPEDAERLLELFPPDEREALASKFSVIPICIDSAEVTSVVHKSSGTPTILHLGTMFWPPNINGVLWFAREVLPLIHETLPDARFVVVGKNPPDEVIELTSDPRIEVTGYVVDVEPYLEAADAFVVPLHAGSGMRVKIVDAWLWALPIVATPIGAEGIDLVDGENIMLAEAPEAFAGAVRRVLTDDVLNQRLRTQGRQWVEDHYDWRQVYKKVDQVYGALMARESIPSSSPPRKVGRHV
jgi:glycosyltransferase involved in cell wall biosynthesis